MNDSIKLLIAGAVIGIAGAVAGGLLVGWATGKTTGETGDRRPKTEMVVSGSRSKPVSPFASLPKSGSSSTRPVGVNTTAAPLTSASSAAFQKAQDTPEVQKAKAEYLEAQKKYVAAMQAAVGGPRPATNAPAPASSGQGKK